MGAGQEEGPQGLTSDKDGGCDVSISQHGLHHCLEVLKRAASAALRVQQHQSSAGPGQHPIAGTWGEQGVSTTGLVGLVSSCYGPKGHGALMGVRGGLR